MDFCFSHLAAVPLTLRRPRQASSFSSGPASSPGGEESTKVIDLTQEFSSEEGDDDDNEVRGSRRRRSSSSFLSSSSAAAALSSPTKCLNSPSSSFGARGRLSPGSSRIRIRSVTPAATHSPEEGRKKKERKQVLTRHCRTNHFLLLRRPPPLICLSGMLSPILLVRRPRTRSLKGRSQGRYGFGANRWEHRSLCARHHYLLVEFNLFAFVVCRQEKIRRQRRATASPRTRRKAGRTGRDTWQKWR